MNVIGIDFDQRLLRPAGVAHCVNKFQSTKGIKPLMKLACELLAGDLVSALGQIGE